MKIRHFYKTAAAGLVAVVLLLMGCGQAHDAKATVSAFLDENLVQSDLSDLEYSKIDSTTHVSAAAIDRMRAEAKTQGIFKKDIKYTGEAHPRTLIYIRVTYRLTNIQGSEKKCAQTFYLDRSLTNVVAFKND